MAERSRAVAANVPGSFFVDDRCIDCDACRQFAPATFGEGRATSYVREQPHTSDERRNALHALVSCPVAAIGSDEDARAAATDFPLALDERCSLCGYNAESSFGANSYLLKTVAGNILVDSPRFAMPLVRAIEKAGGIAYIFLTHRDDVADASRFAAHFDAERIIHRADLSAQRDAEIVVDGALPYVLAPGITVIPTPGHTRGHCVLHVDDRYLFTGDTLAYDRDARRLVAWQDVCWYSWPEQLRSLARLVNLTFEWVLPGHGDRIEQPAGEMQRQLRDIVTSQAAYANTR